MSDRVEGTSLNTLLNYSQVSENFLSPAFCLYVGAEVASALHYARTPARARTAPRWASFIGT